MNFVSEELLINPLLIGRFVCRITQKTNEKISMNLGRRTGLGFWCEPDKMDELRNSLTLFNIFVNSSGNDGTIWRT